MNDWMNPTATATPQARVATSETNTENDRALRLMDLALASLAACMLLAFSPLLIWAWWSGEIHTESRCGHKRIAFNQRTWRFAETRNGRCLNWLGARNWPLLISIFRGDMAWVGPRARRLDEAAGPAANVRPGLTGLHQLRRATSVDFGSEDSSEASYLSERGLVNDLRLLVLSRWNGVGRHQPAAHAEAPAKVHILDTSVDNLTMDSAVQRVMAFIESGSHAKVGFVNPACANIAAASHAYRRDVASFDLVLPDGIGMKIAADWLGTPIRQNVNGTDFFPRLCGAMQERGQRLYLLGARPEVVARVAEVVGERWPGIELVGAQHGYFNRAQETSIAQDIQESGAHVVLVAMGVPAQEDFIARLGDRMGPCVAIGVGGLFDFVAGRISRAPQWMRDAGLEWTWRLLQEPGRMWQRYLVGNARFLARVAMQRWGWRNAQTFEARSALATKSQGHQTAVLLACHEIDTGVGTQLAASLPFGPCSFAEMAVAQLASQSIRHIHVLLAPNTAHSAELQQQLGNGRRWGVDIHWHQSAKADAPYQPLRAMADHQTQSMLLIDAHTWLNAQGMERILSEPQITVRIGKSGSVAWQGWACVSPGDLSALGDCTDAQALEAKLMERLTTFYIAMPSERASADTRESWLAAQTAVPAKALAALQTDVWTAHSWGYASAHAHISPDAHIEGPVWIGPGCVVRADAHLGPHVTLTHNVVIDKHAAMAHAVALPEAFVAADSSASEGVCFAAPSDGDIDPFELALPAAQAPRAATPSESRRTRWLGWAIAGLLAPVVLPWMGLRKLMGCRAAWVSQRVVIGRTHMGARLRTVTLRQPLTGHRRAAVLLAWYGALLDVAQGRRQWVGVRARRVEEWFALETDTRDALNFAAIGLWHPVAWTNRLDCVLHSEAAADRMWLARQQAVASAAHSDGQPRMRWTTGLMSYRSLTVS